MRPTIQADREAQRAVLAAPLNENDARLDRWLCDQQRYQALQVNPDGPEDDGQPNATISQSLQEADVDAHHGSIILEAHEAESDYHSENHEAPGADGVDEDFLSWTDDAFRGGSDGSFDDVNGNSRELERQAPLDHADVDAETVSEADVAGSATFSLADLDDSGPSQGSSRSMMCSHDKRHSSRE